MTSPKNRRSWLLVVIGIVVCGPAFAAEPARLERLADLPTTVSDLVPEEIAFAVSLSKKVYRPGEAMIMTSTIRNAGSRRVRAYEPCVSTHGVHFTVFRIEKGERKPEGGQGFHLNCAGNFPWLSSARIHELAPGDRVSLTCNIERYVGGGLGGLASGLPPGKYVLQPTYTLSYVFDPKVEFGPRESVKAPEIHFKVRKLDRAEQTEWDALKAAYDHLKPGNIASDSGPLVKFLDDHPQSVYRREAHMALLWDRQAAKDVAGEIACYDLMREEGLFESASVELRDSLRSMEGSAYLRFGDLAGAYRVYAESHSRNLIDMREFVERKIRQEEPALVPHLMEIGSPARNSPPGAGAAERE